MQEPPKSRANRHIHSALGTAIQFLAVAFVAVITIVAMFLSLIAASHLLSTIF